MAAAPPPPVDVFIPPGPAPPEGPIFVNAADTLVTSLPWLQWGPAAMVGGALYPATGPCNSTDTEEQSSPVLTDFAEVRTSRVHSDAAKYHAH